MQNIESEFPLSELPQAARQFIKEDLLYFDIETTGLSSARNRIYCIGTGWRKGDTIHIRVLLTDTRAEEPLLLSAFLEQSRSYPRIAAFNGNTFDLPFIRKRAALYDQPDPFADKTILDLYKESKKASGLFRMPSHKQKSYEDFLGLHREDTYNGGQLIHVYHQYEQDHDREKLHALWLHNYEDVKGMFLLTSLLSYPLFLEGHYNMEEPRTDSDPSPVLQIRFTLENTVPKSIHLFRDTGSLLLRENAGFLEIPIHRETLRHYFKDYKNYYYLPMEGTVVHKSVGQFVDPAHREKAGKENCYVEKTGNFLWLPKKNTNGYYRKNLKDKDTWLDLDAVLTGNDISEKDTDTNSENSKQNLSAFIRDTLQILGKGK